MWIILAILSAMFAGGSSILVKVGIKHTDSDVATFIRTIVVVIMSLLMVLIVKSFPSISSVNAKSWIFLCLSGITTGLSWLCYYKALSIGDVNKVVPIDKSSTIITIIFSFILFHEDFNAFKVIAIILIGIGTYLMIEKKETSNKLVRKRWLIFAMLSAILATFTSLLSKAGISGVESNLGTLIRTIVVLIMSLLIILFNKKYKQIPSITKRELLFIILSGIATGMSWLCYYKAMKDGMLSVVVSIDKLSIIVTILFSTIFLHEKLSLKALIGLIIISTGTLLIALL